jgi:hypothetical protein
MPLSMLCQVFTMSTHHGYSFGHQLFHQGDDDLATEVYLATANFKIHMMRSGI